MSFQPLMISERITDFGCVAIVRLLKESIFYCRMAAKENWEQDVDCIENVREFWLDKCAVFHRSVSRGSNPAHIFPAWIRALEDSSLHPTYRFPSFPTVRIARPSSGHAFSTFGQFAYFAFRSRVTSEMGRE